MKLSKNFDSKNNIISIIEKFFDIEKIKQIAVETNFVKRESKLDAIKFFSVYVF